MKIVISFTQGGRLREQHPTGASDSVDDLHMKLEQASYRVSDLIDLVNRGKLALPEFQRPYVWPPSEIAELLRAVTRKWPVGTFLLLRLPRRRLFQLKPLEGAPALKGPELMILDGQQ